jgi:hypothetical protein
MAEVVEHLPGMHEALGSIPYTTHTHTHTHTHTLYIYIYASLISNYLFMQLKLRDSSVTLVFHVTQKNLLNAGYISVFKNLINHVTTHLSNITYVPDTKKTVK